MLAISEALISNNGSTSGQRHNSISFKILLLFAASNRNPSTPSDSKSFAYWASLERTYSVSVARLDTKG